MTMVAPVASESWTEWCEQLPADWTARELRRVAEISASNVDKIPQEGEIAVRLCNYTDVYYNDVITPELNFMEATATAIETARFRLRGGEVLLTKDSETAEDIAIPAFVMPGLENVVCGYHLYLLRPDPEKVDGRFLMRACSVSPVKDQFVTAANGITRFGLGQQDLGSSLVPVPPLPVQRKVADFLDRETAKIDRLIEEKQRLIDLLEEKRTALITRAVTKGLGPDVEMKDSEVQWLGQIPARWQVVKLKRTWERSDYGLSLSLAGVGSVPVLTMGDIQDGGITIPEAGSLDLDSIPSDLFLRNGDLLYNRTNSLALVGKVGLFEEPATRAVTFASYVVRLRLKKGASPRYYNYLLNTPSFLELAQSHSLLSINQANLNPTRYGGLSVPLPPSHEQLEIVRFLDREGASLRQLRESIIKAVDLLKEYRSALISAAVTGKIDVRGHAA